MDDRLTQVLAGSGIGAAIGGLGSLARRRRSWRQTLRDAGMGALGGGGVAALAGLAAGRADRPAPKTEPTSTPTADKPVQDARRNTDMNPHVATALGALNPLLGGAHGVYAGTKQDGLAGGALQGVGSLGLSVGGARGAIGVSDVVTKLLSSKGMPAYGARAPVGMVGAGLGAALAALVGNEVRADRARKKEAAVDPSIIDDAGLFSDLLTLPSSNRRLGRAAGLAEGLGVDAPMTTRLPTTTRMMRLGLTTGGGGALGYQLGKRSENPEGGALGAAAGVLGGAAVGTVWDALARRRAASKTIERLEEAITEGRKPNPVLDRGSILAALVSGVHQQGRADAAEHLSFGRKRFKGNPALTVAQLLSGAPVIGPAAHTGMMIGSATNYQDSRGRIQRARPQARTNAYDN